MTPEQPQESARRRGGRRLFYSLFYLASAAALATLRLERNVRFSGASPKRLAAGTAYLPYQYRALVPWMAKTLNLLGPPGGQRAIYYGLEVGAISALLFSFRWYLSLVLSPGRRERAWPLALLLLYPLVMHYLFWVAYPVLYYPYDMPALAFTTVGLALLHQGRLGLYYPLFTLATINRETSCYLTVTQLFTTWRQGIVTKGLTLHMGAQLLIWVVVKWGLWLAYGGNKMNHLGVVALFENNIPRNFQRLADPWAWLALASCFGMLWLPTLLRRRSIQDPFVRRSLLVLPLLFVGMGVTGNVTELRIYGEGIPIMTAAFIAAYFGGGDRDRKDT